MLAKTPKPTTAELIEQIVDGVKPFPQFPEAFGPLDRSPNINYFTRRLLNPVAEAERVIARNKARREGAK